MDILDGIFDRASEMLQETTWVSTSSLQYVKIQMILRDLADEKI